MEHATASRNDAARLLAVRRWTLWSHNRDLIAYAIGLVLVAIFATVAAGFVAPAKASDLAILAVLGLLGVVQAELGRQVERVRPRVSGTIHINLTSVWFLPAVLLLPPVLVALLIVALYWHLHFRSWYSSKQIPMFRTALNIAISIVTCYLTQAAAATTGVDGIREALHAGWVGAAAVAISIGSYFLVNMVLVMPALNRSRGFQHLIGSWADNLFELATLCVGAVVAVVLAAMPALAVLIVPPLFLLHRAVLINQLEAAARRDPKTGVWNIAGWHRKAYQELVHAERRPSATFGVLMVDLDRFKRVNDTHGHLIGDAVLKAVADTITATVRARDAVGRFGGEEFMVLLPDTTADHVGAIAERIRAAIATLDVTVTAGGRSCAIRGLSASIGLAVYPTAGTAIERLLQAADAAMYKAKSNGRNQVAS